MQHVLRNLVSHFLHLHAGESLGCQRLTALFTRRLGLLESNDLWLAGLLLLLILTDGFGCVQGFVARRVWPLKIIIYVVGVDVLVGQEQFAEEVELVRFLAGPEG
jgi:hypothetical protein